MNCFIFSSSFALIDSMECSSLSSFLLLASLLDSSSIHWDAMYISRRREVVWTESIRLSEIAMFNTPPTDIMALWISLWSTTDFCDRFSIKTSLLMLKPLSTAAFRVPQTASKCKCSVNELLADLKTYSSRWTHSKQGLLGRYRITWAEYIRLDQEYT